MFNKETVFPAFTKDSDNIYYLYLLRTSCISFANQNLEVILANRGCLLSYGSETQITKKEFIEANKESLEKTGLINLFEGSNSELKQRLRIAIQYDKAQVKEIECLEVENKHLRKGLSASNKLLADKERVTKKEMERLKEVHQKTLSQLCKVENELDSTKKLLANKETVAKKEMERLKEIALAHLDENNELKALLKRYL